MLCNDLRICIAIANCILLPYKQHKLSFLLLLCSDIYTFLSFCEFETQKGDRGLSRSASTRRQGGDKFKSRLISRH